MLAFGWLALVCGNALGPSVEYLSDVQNERIVYQTQGWGAMGIDTAVKPMDGRNPMPLLIKGVSYEKGLGHHAPGEILVELNGEYAAFDVEAGVQQQDSGAGSVIFQLFVDDEKRFDSGIMRGSDAAKPVHVSLEGADILRLVVTDAGDGITCDCANWADARLTRAETATRKPSSTPLDIAPFGRVATWDPARMDGARSTRIQEFPAEDVYLETPVKPDKEGYAVPIHDDDRGCIGLQWAEARLLKNVSIVFTSENAPVPGDTTVQFWAGESPWQGEWKPLAGEVRREGNQWIFDINLKHNLDFPRMGTEKIRWIIPEARSLPLIQQLSAHTRSNWTETILRIECEEPAGEDEGRIEIYNGMLMPDSMSEAQSNTSCPLRDTVRLKVKYSRPRPSKSDRTVLRIQTKRGACGIAVEDVLALKRVYVPAIGIYAAPDSDPMSLAAYRDSLAGYKSVLERVRAMPDQSLGQALEHTHNPVQDNGPTMLSLACDNRKVIVHRDGVIQFEPFGKIPAQTDGGTHPACFMRMRFGSGKTPVAKRVLRGEWLPAPEITLEEGGVTCRQSVFVTPGGRPLATAPQWLYDKPVCVVDYAFEGTGEISLGLSVADGDRTYKPETASHNKRGWFVERGRLLAHVAMVDEGLRCSTVDNELAITGRITNGNRLHCTVFMPLWEVLAAEWEPEPDSAPLFADFREYWERIMAGAMQIEIPDPLLGHIIRASQAHCLLAARNERDGATVAAWIASDRYGPLESEAHAPIYGMDLMGHQEYARRSLDFFIQRYSPDGLLTTGYTLMGTGWHLWTLARHQALWQDKTWFDLVAPKAAQAAHWIARQCEKTRRTGRSPEETPEAGLVPPGVGADWNRFAYRFAIQAHYYAGLREIADALDTIRHPQAGRLSDEAGQFRKAILHAYRWNQARTPAWPLFSGLCIPAYSGMLYGFGTTGEMIPGEDGNRSWAYDVELGAHHLVPLGVIAPGDSETEQIMDHMENIWFLQNGMGDYPAEKNEADFFNRGGFSKVQPYYTRNAEIYALRDDIKPFLRSYFNALAAQVSLENLSLWEHFHNIGAWNKTHETGWFLVQTRTLFITEHGEELWLAPFAPSQWFNDGSVIAIENAPTRFGPAGYRIVSSVSKGHIDASITVPGRSMPEAIVLRVRHPKDLPMKSVEINGTAHSDFDPSKAIVRLTKSIGTSKIRIVY